MQKYFDNAATSFPKPREVIDSIIEFHNECGASPGRGAYSRAKQATDILDECGSKCNGAVDHPIPIHDIEVDPLDAGRNGLIHGLFKFTIIRGEDAWSDNHDSRP